MNHDIKQQEIRLEKKSSTNAIEDIIVTFKNTKGKQTKFVWGPDPQNCVSYQP